MSGARRSHHGVLIANTLIGSLLALVALWGSWGAWLKHRNPIDLSLSVAALTWMMHLAVTSAVQLSGTSVQSAYVTDAGFQVLIVSISFFLLTSAGLKGRGIYVALGSGLDRWRVAAWEPLG